MTQDGVAFAIGVMACVAMAGCSSEDSEHCEVEDRWKSEQSWTSMNEALLRVYRKHGAWPLSREDLCMVEEFQRLQDDATDDALRIILRQCKYPLVRLAAYYVVKHRTPQDAIYAGAQLLASSENVSFAFVLPVAEDIRSLADTEENTAKLDSLRSVQWDSFENCVFVVGLFDGELLWTYYHDKKGQLDQPVRDAVLVKLFAHSKSPSKLMQQQVVALRNRAGDALLTYLLFADSDTKDYAMRVVEWINGDNVSRTNVKSVVTHRTEWYAAAVDDNSLPFSEEGRTLLRNVVNEVNHKRVESR
jgi:hypothetical protein